MIPTSAFGFFNADVKELALPGGLHGGADGALRGTDVGVKGHGLGHIICREQLLQAGADLSISGAFRGLVPVRKELLHDFVTHSTGKLPVSIRFQKQRRIHQQQKKPPIYPNPSQAQVAIPQGRRVLRWER